MSTLATTIAPQVFSIDAFYDALRRSELVDEAEVNQWQEGTPRGADARKVAAQMVNAGLVTKYQGNQILSGKYRGFVLGPYRIRDLLSEGNKDAIYLAEHRDMNRFVAIKVLKTNVDHTPLTRERLKREARITAALSHKHIVKLYDMVDENGQQYLVMEYVEGKTLKQLLADQGPLPIPLALEYIAQVAEGLEHAHDKGIIHRDIKPSSLILDKTGIVKILDMGHCRFSDDQKMNITKMYDPTSVVGTVDYTAPEQALGEAYDLRCDLYSLGATLFTLISGRAPFLGSSYQVLMAHQVDEVPALNEFQPSATPALQAVVNKMMAKIPQHRYQTAGEIIDAIRRLQKQSMPSKRSSPSHQPMGQTKRSSHQVAVPKLPPRMTIEVPPAAVSPAVVKPTAVSRTDNQVVAPQVTPVVQATTPRRSNKLLPIIAGILAMSFIGLIVYWRFFAG